MLLDHKPVAYNFARKFFEFASGFKPDLAQRLDLYRMIPDDADACRMKDLLTRVLRYVSRGDRP